MAGNLAERARAAYRNRALRPCRIAEQRADSLAGRDFFAENRRHRCGEPISFPAKFPLQRSAIFFCASLFAYFSLTCSRLRRAARVLGRNGPLGYSTGSRRPTEYSPFRSTLWPPADRCRAAGSPPVLCRHDCPWRPASVRRFCDKRLSHQARLDRGEFTPLTNG